MKHVIDFDPSRELIFVPGVAHGPRGDVRLNLVVDTGATETTLVPEVADALGYSARSAERFTSVSSALGREAGYLLRVDRFSSLGLSQSSFRVHVLDLSELGDIDGLLGLSFLRDTHLELLFREGKLLIEAVR